MSAVEMHLPGRPLAVAAPAAEVRTWRDLTFVFLALFAVTLGVYAIDERLLHGISVWIKPLKFQASLALHFATLALLAERLPAARRRTRGFRAVVSISAAAGLFEIGWIMLQAARGRASHFNDQTVLEMVMYGLMGVGAVLLVAAPFIMGIMLLRDRGRTMRGDPLLAGATLGLIVSAVMTLVVAGYLSTTGSHWVGDVTSDAGGLPLFGWSQQVGDLRVPHFFATHAMQLLPLAGLALQGAGKRGSFYVAVAGGTYLLFIVAVFVQALQGKPFLVLGG